MDLSKFFVGVCLALVATCISCVGYTALLLHSLDTRLSIIEKNGFTQAQGHLLQRQIDRREWWERVIEKNTARIQGLERKP